MHTEVQSEILKRRYHLLAIDRRKWEINIKINTTVTNEFVRLMTGTNGGLL
jgi:hypothetical protein